MAHLVQIQIPHAVASYLDLARAQLEPDEFQALEAEFDDENNWLRFDIDPVASICRVASVLKSYPVLFYNFNSISGSFRIYFSLYSPSVNFFVVVDGTTATMFSASSTNVRALFSDASIREKVVDEEAWADLLGPTPIFEWCSCIAEILRVILDDPLTDARCWRRSYRRLQIFAKNAILPPSMFIRLDSDDRDQYDRGPLQARGGYAEIYKGYVNGEVVCFRVLQGHGQTKKARARLYKDFCREAFLWSQLNHPNVLPILGVSLDMDPHELCFITPWFNNGNIMRYLESHPDYDRLAAIQDIVEGITYLHGLEPPVTHRDIKGANILVGDNAVCYLADFGLSSAMESQRLEDGPGSSAFSLLKGSLFWMAPERMRPTCSKFSALKDARPADIYALACTILEIYTGHPPFYESNPVAALVAVLEGRRPALPPPGDWTKEEKEIWWLVDLCWKQLPEQRPHIGLIKNFLKDIKDWESPPPSSLPAVETLALDTEAHRGWLDAESSLQVPSMDFEASGTLPPSASLMSPPRMTKKPMEENQLRIIMPRPVALGRVLATRLFKGLATPATPSYPTGTTGDSGADSS